MSSLVIGSSSQLGHYFPEDYVCISSRDYDLDSLCHRRWDSVYICFAEQRTYLAHSQDKAVSELFWRINLEKTKDTIIRLQEVADKIVYYSTAELWNNTCGPVDEGMPFRYHANNYTSSKEAITIELKDKKKYPKVSIVYPFNFNSIHRGDKYLFGKVFGSIIRNERVTIGDTDYYRELLHPKMVVEGSIASTMPGRDVVLGSGRLVHVGDFIRNLYSFFGKDYDEYVQNDQGNPSIYRTNIFYSANRCPGFDEVRLFELTVSELKQAIIGFHHEKANHISK
jgi:hypothetical protein